MIICALLVLAVLGFILSTVKSGGKLCLSVLLLAVVAFMFAKIPVDLAENIYSEQAFTELNTSDYNSNEEYVITCSTSSLLKYKYFREGDLTTEITLPLPFTKFKKNEQVTFTGRTIEYKEVFNGDKIGYVSKYALKSK